MWHKKMKAKVIVMFLWVSVFVGAVYAKEPTQSEVISKTLKTLNAQDQQKLKKAIKAADKFMKLYLGDDVCGCEPTACIKVVQPLLDYPLYDPKLDKTCGADGYVDGRKLKWESPYYAIDTDGHIVAIDFNASNNTVLFKYESTFIARYDMFLSSGQYGVGLWDISIQGQIFKSEVTINLANYKVIVAQTQDDMMPEYYTTFIEYTKELPDFFKNYSAKDFGNETKEHQYQMIKKVLSDIETYKRNKSLNNKH